MDAVDRIGLTLSEPWCCIPEALLAVNAPSPENVVLTWRDNRSSTHAGDIESAPLINDPICFKEYNNEFSEDKANNPHFLAYMEAEPEKRSLFDHDLSLPEGCQYVLLQESVKVKHRRTQNRLSQRAYRQRREEERKKLLDDVKGWRDKCLELEDTCNRLSAALSMMIKNLRQIEVDKEALRLALSSMACQYTPI